MLTLFPQSEVWKEMILVLSLTSPLFLLIILGPYSIGWCNPQSEWIFPPSGSLLFKCQEVYVLRDSKHSQLTMKVNHCKSTSAKPSSYLLDKNYYFGITSLMYVTFESFTFVNMASSWNTFLSLT